MEEKELNGGIPTPDTDTTVENKNETPVNNNEAPAPQSEEKRFTQEELNKIISERLEKEKVKSHAKGVEEVCKKYGVNTIDELDAIVEQSRGNKRELLFLKNNIDDTRYDDVITYFKGKGVDLTQDTLKEALETHPEWNKKTLTITQVGNDKREIKPEDDTKAVLKEYWGL